MQCMRDDAKVVLDSGFGTHPGESDIVYRNRKMYAETAITALEKQLNNGWILCSDRLPEKQNKHQKRRELLVTTNTGIVGVMQFEFKSNDFWEAGDENHLTHWQEDSEDFAVIAWMPLPEPYINLQNNVNAYIKTWRE